MVIETKITVSMYQHSLNSFVIKQLQISIISPKNWFFGRQKKLFAIQFLLAIRICVPPDYPRVLCTLHGYQIAGNDDHSLYLSAADDNRP